MFDGTYSQLSRHRSAALEPHPVHVYSEVHPIIVNGAYCQESVDRVVALLPNEAVRAKPLEMHFMY